MDSTGNRSNIPAGVDEDVQLCIVHSEGVWTLTAVHRAKDLPKPKFEIVISLEEKPPIVYHSNR